MGDRAGFADRILDCLSSGVVAIDAAGTVRVLNAGARRVLGYPEGGELGRDCREVLADHPALVRLLIDALAGRAALSRAELELETANGRTLPIGFTLTPLRDAAGDPGGAAMLFRDLTPIERSDEQQRLRERLAALGQMAAGLAHAIRNPLASAHVMAGLLQRRLADRPEQQAMVAELMGELHALADTVDASLDFVRPVAVSRRRLCPRTLLEDSLALASSRVFFAGEIERHYDADLPDIDGDPEQLRTALTDLIVNALEAMSAGGVRAPRLCLGLRSRQIDRSDEPVRLAANGERARAQPARELVFSVADSGPGVAEDLREKVFYPFFTTKPHGSGVGLANAQKIAASHAGSLELESVAGAGSAFHLRVPMEVCEP
jgi:PAS domain S-box-containing protein